MENQKQPICPKCTNWRGNKCPYESNGSAVSCDKFVEYVHYLDKIELPNKLLKSNHPIVKAVNQETAEKLVVEEHYSHNLPNRNVADYGIYFVKDSNMELGGVCCFGPPSTPDSYKILPSVKETRFMLELTRMAIYRWCPNNSASFLVSRSLRLLAKTFPDIIVCISYADTLEGHIGFAYQSSNWTYLGRQRGNRSYLRQEDGSLLHPRTAFARYGTSSNIDLRMELVEMPDKHLYVYQLKSNEDVTKDILARKQPYPKRLSSKDKTLTNQVRDSGSNPTQPLQSKHETKQPTLFDFT